MVLSLSRIDRRRAKVLARNLAAAFCRGGLGWLGRPYRPAAGPSLVIAPHPDDETLGCGGLIARKRQAGLPVHVVFITDGSASHLGHPELSQADLTARRHREALEALAVLGVESCAIEFLNEDDGALDGLPPGRQEQLVTRLAGLLARIQPAEIFLPCSPDGSSEHDAAFRHTCTALARTGLRPAVWEYPVWSWWNPGLLITRMLSHRGHSVLPTEDYQPIKTRALSRYRSQVEPTPPWPDPALPRELVRSCNSDREFFFRFPLPPPGTDFTPAPVI